MKLFTGWMMAAGLVLSAAAANAQIVVPHGTREPDYAVVSDFSGPYAAMPDEIPVPRYGLSLLPPEEIYAVVRESGFSPLGMPHLRGFVYSIAVIGRRGGDDGRLLIDARNGRIVRFMPAYRMGDNFNGDLTDSYGPRGPLPPLSAVRGPPRPPGNIPHVASRTPPMPAPPAAKPVAEPAQAQQSAAAQAKPAPAAATETTGSVPAKPAPQILPTQQMPQAQGLD